MTAVRDPTKPLRAALDKRVLWAISLIDDRLGRREVTVHDRFDDVEKMARATLQATGWAQAEEGTSSLERLDAARAAYLNWATGPEGYASQAGMWFNPPVPVEHHEGRVDVLLVNERIVEQPWVFAALPSDQPCRVLDVGGSESTVALSLATLGHTVDVVDPRGYPLAHPNLTAHACRLDELDGDRRWDVAIALSSVEHFGLQHYGQHESDAREDLAALAQLRGVSDRLVLTVPFGPEAEIAGFERIYDEAGLGELLEGWDVEQRLVVERVDRTTWRACETPSGRAVAMVTATPTR
ncbi:MAG TPA: hypothetical protein VFZ89_18565 [Solirubrobacteraceae bacterium]